MFNYIHNVYPDYREIEITIKLKLTGSYRDFPTAFTPLYLSFFNHLSPLRYTFPRHLCTFDSKCNAVATMTTWSENIGLVYATIKGVKREIFINDYINPAIESEFLFLGSWLPQNLGEGLYGYNQAFSFTKTCQNSKNLKIFSSLLPTNFIHIFDFKKLLRRFTT